MNTTNVSAHAPGVPLIYIALRERNSLPQKQHTPSIRTCDGGISLTGEINFLTMATYSA
jgi:hypothetical protein